MTNRIVVGVDDCVAGLQALRHAVDEARHRRVAVHAVRAWQFNTAWKGAVVDTWKAELATQAAKVVVEAFQAAMGGQPADVEVLSVVVEAAPGPALVGYARGSDDLLILGTCQHTALRRAMHGSVATYCVNHAACPVLVVPPPQLARAGSTRALTRELHREAQRFANAANAGRAA